VDRELRDLYRTHAALPVAEAFLLARYRGCGDDLFISPPSVLVEDVFSVNAERAVEELAGSQKPSGSSLRRFATPVKESACGTQTTLTVAHEQDY
jgi:hypothetical protein